MVWLVPVRLPLELSVPLSVSLHTTSLLATEPLASPQERERERWRRLFWSSTPSVLQWWWLWHGTSLTCSLCHCTHTHTRMHARTHVRTGECVSVGAFQVPGGQGSMCTIHKPRAVCTVATHFSNSLLCRDSMNPFSM